MNSHSFSISHSSMIHKSELGYFQHNILFKYGRVRGLFLITPNRFGISILVLQFSSHSIFHFFYSVTTASSVFPTAPCAWAHLPTSWKASLVKPQDMKCLATLNLLDKLNAQHIMFTWFGNRPVKMWMVRKITKLLAILLHQRESLILILTVNSRSELTLNCI